jgi:hypothetical protein
MQVKATALLANIHNILSRLTREEDDNDATDEDIEALQRYQADLNKVLELCDPRSVIVIDTRRFFI